MNAVFVDFEMNPIGRRQKQVRRICKSEIIEIGAVMIDEAGREISSYKSYVRPEYMDSIHTVCQELTGITMEMLVEAPHFQEAYGKFLEWCNRDGDNNYEIYAWSENDWRQLHAEMRLKAIDVTAGRVQWMMQHWQNFQRIYCNLLGLTQIISLDKAVSTMGETFDGQMHDALWDARNTAKIYVLSKQSDEFYRVMKPIIEAMKPAEPLTYSLAEAFQAAKSSV